MATASTPRPTLERGGAFGFFAALAVLGCTVSSGTVSSAAPPAPSAPAPTSAPTPSTSTPTSTSASTSTSALLPPPPPRDEPFADLERELGGRLGVFALDTESGESLARRADERFATCSTFKWALAASVLARVDAGNLQLSDRIEYAASDLLEYAPVTRPSVAAGSLSVEALCEAVVTVSDNTAANLLLEEMGGPSALTRFLRSVGDRVTRLDRFEPELNENALGDERDTTSPRAMVGAMRAILTGPVLSEASRAQLVGWLEQSRTGRERIRAGLPPDFRAGDKTGSCRRGAVNDVAIVWPPERAPLLLAVYATGGSAPLERFNRAHAAVARRVVETLVGTHGSREGDRGDDGGLPR